MSDTRTLTDHDEIKAWADERGGKPATVADTGDRKEPGILRLDFGEENEGLTQIGWGDWFEAFDDNRLALLVQDKTSDGDTSRFNKLVSRD